MIDFNLVIFVILFVINIVLCIVEVPIFGFAFGFLSVVVTGLVFMQDSNININFSYILIVLAFISIIINGFNIKGKKKRK